MPCLPCSERLSRAQWCPAVAVAYCAARGPKSQTGLTRSIVHAPAALRSNPPAATATSCSRRSGDDVVFSNRAATGVRFSLQIRPGLTEQQQGREDQKKEPEGLKTRWICWGYRRPERSDLSPP